MYRSEKLLQIQNPVHHPGDFPRDAKGENRREGSDPGDPKAEQKLVMTR
jgi:hypothetical protein